MRESGEDYLETIYLLSQRNAELHAVDIANELGYARPSITRALNILKSKALITVDSSNHIFLTEQGLAVAKRIYERHQCLTQFLISLGVSAEIADKDACRIEHVLSEESLDKIKLFLQNKDQQ